MRVLIQWRTDASPDEEWSLAQDYMFPPFLEALELSSAVLPTSAVELPPSIRELGVNGVSLKSIAYRTAAELPSLSVLSFGNCKQEYARKLLATVGHAVTRLSNFTESYEELYMNPDVCRLLPVLEHLEIDVPLTHEQYLGLPPTLRSFTMNAIACTDSMVDFHKLLRDPTFLPALTYVPQVYEQFHLEQMHETPAPWDTVRDALQACKSRGLVVRKFPSPESYHKQAVLAEEYNDD
jgi:hypothetical protein